MGPDRTSEASTADPAADRTGERAEVIDTSAPRPCGDQPRLRIDRAHGTPSGVWHGYRRA